MVAYDLFNSQADSSFGSGVKEDTIKPSTTTGSTPLSKSDLTRLYVAKQNVGGQKFLYLAWQRWKESGDTTLDFEFNQSEQVYATGLPVRTAGDLLFTYDLTPQGSVEISFRKWVDNPSVTGDEKWGTATNLSTGGFAVGAINGSSVQDPVGDGAPRTLDPFTFGELAINLTAAGIFAPGSCVNFGSAHLKSRASSSFSAQMKDFVAPIEVNIGNCGFAISKTGDALSKVGDDVNYTITITNTSEPGSGPLTPQSISDTLLGTLNPAAFTESLTDNNLVGSVTDPYDGSVTAINLAPGGTYTETGSFVIPAGASDPFTRTASVTASPAGFPNVLTASDGHETDLFQPSITIDLSGDTLSKIGDAIDYTILVTNTTSANTPNLVGSVTDPYDGSVTAVNLAPGGTYTETGNFVISAGASDPFTRSASVTASPAGFPNVLTASDGHSIDLFQPSILVTKTGSTAASVGDAATYTITIQNTGSADAPDLVNPVVTDTLLGDLFDPGNPYVTGLSGDSGSDQVLGGGETWTITASRTVLLSDPDPLPNTVTATFNPAGFPNEVTGSDNHAVDILQPLLRVVKTPDGATVAPGDTATFTIVVTNIGAGRAIHGSLTDALPNPDGTLQPLTWTTSTPGFSVVNSVLSGTINELDGDPTPGTINGDEDSFTVVVSTVIPSDYLAPQTDPGGPGSLGSNFEVDGNLIVDNPGVTLDWGSAVPAPGTLPGFVNKLDAPSGQSDDSFGQGSKEDTAAPLVVSGSIPKNKSDLTNFLFAQEAVDGNNFVYLGWLRANTLGTANMDFELNQSTAISSNQVTPVRTVGDALIAFDFASGGNKVELSLRSWQGSQWGPAIDLDQSGSALGAVNSGTVANPLAPGSTLAANTFGEAVVNLTQAFAADCRTFASVYVKSRSSDSFSSALKDFIAPIAATINTCQTVPLPNEAFATADNVVGTVSDTGLINVSNDPDAALAAAGSAATSASSAAPLDTNGDGVVSPVDA